LPQGFNQIQRLQFSQPGRAGCFRVEVKSLHQGTKVCCNYYRQRWQLSRGKDSIISQSHTIKVKISLFPHLGTGNTVIEAVKVLVEHGVQPSIIILLSLFSTPHGKSRPLPSLQRCQIHHPGIPRDRHFNDGSSLCCTHTLWTEVFWNRLT